MKKTASIIIITLIVSLFTLNSYAASLDAISVNLSKSTVKPGEEITLTVNFGEKLGAYTFNFEYDSKIFNYGSVVGGTANDTGDKVIVTFHDSTGGSEPRSNMTITFKAKEEITSSTQAQFKITAEGLTNSDATVTYDDITNPIVKDVTVEPQISNKDIVGTQETTPIKEQTTTPETTNATKNLTSGATPKQLPKTGNNTYVVGISVLVILSVCYLYYNKKY